MLVVAVPVVVDSGDVEVSVAVLVEDNVVWVASEDVETVGVVLVVAVAVVPDVALVEVGVEALVVEEAELEDNSVDAVDNVAVELSDVAETVGVVATDEADVVLDGSVEVSVTDVVGCVSVVLLELVVASVVEDNVTSLVDSVDG